MHLSGKVRLQVTGAALVAEGMVGGRGTSAWWRVCSARALGLSAPAGWNPGRCGHSPGTQTAVVLVGVAVMVLVSFQCSVGWRVTLPLRGLVPPALVLAMAGLQQ